MASYLIPPSDILKAQTYTPKELAADAEFDAWLIANKYDFVTQFHNAWRSGVSTFTYTVTNESNSTAQNTVTSVHDYLTNTTYGYTVSDPEQVILGTWKIIITFP